MDCASRHPQKHLILREVYQDNLGVRPRPGAGPIRAMGPLSLPAPARHKPWRAALMAGLCALLLPLAPAPQQGQLTATLPPLAASPAPPPSITAPAGGHGEAAGAQAPPARPRGYRPGPLLPDNVLLDHPLLDQATAQLSLITTADTLEGWVPDLGGEPWNLAALVTDTATPLAELFGLQVRTIVIDPGHGGRDFGAVGAAGVAEKNITLDVALQLKTRLERSGLYRILLTRAEDRWLSLRQRVRFANRSGADLFVSIHVNALPVPAPPVIETYYFGPQSDAAALRLARLENRGSGFPMAGFKKLLAGLGKTLRHQESRKLAEAVQHNLYTALSPHSDTIINVGLKTAPFMVLLGVQVPAILAEVTSLSNPGEEQRLKSAAYRERIARALEQGILDYLKQHPSPNEGDRYAGEKARSRG